MNEERYKAKQKKKKKLRNKENLLMLEGKKDSKGLM